ncbi:type II toxin-antitoxin system VapC family toxin [Trueperella pecoris]|uniref:type II toxin-antitoxin system VapC family toxin n=1 Tax=Trueperella pecoris TaxID=2733571 RepID=UPI00186B94FF|nr:type II toxin-antitoxin system VapC family toxin [Trueperella pecoris]QOQ39671.1 type II toxin-antitoxin system VapC family toxin [Trueperella pecoris]QTG75542.1 type II toxin-antitoxin system VapC family toxin [Trueperella pecoris]
MIVDTSALVAVAYREPGYERITDLLFARNRSKMSVASVLELQLVLRSSELADELIEIFNVDPVGIDVAQLRVARHAAQRFGKGTGSKAGLNYGDCFSYALAMTAGEPLLFVGEDFTHTDVVVA